MSDDELLFKLARGEFRRAAPDKGLRRRFIASVARAYRLKGQALRQQIRIKVLICQNIDWKGLAYQ